MAPRFETLNRADLDRTLRRHVTNPIEWGNVAGTDFWLLGGGLNQLTASLPSTLSNFGWTTTTQVAGNASAGNLLVKTTTGIPKRWAPTAASSTLLSPKIFGDYYHARQAMLILGKRNLPRYLIGDFIAAFSTVANAEVKGGLGFGYAATVQSGNTDAEKVAFISSDATEFILSSAAGASSILTNTTAIDTAVHRWRIIFDVNAGVVRWYIDGVAQNTIPVQLARFPVSMEVTNSAGNVCELNSAHIYYAWSIPADV